ncbi:XisH family protein [Thiothrix subterranea]|uniref:XisH family protein n=1 Tax=Thiothrix subterranea TaxID=2735563 RepID=A0AA51MJ13_9GAMM|nr:XisH family protein [Thiothrix subterranea]MDQ5768028.1 XisH family protein [Thiothrix subterranea]WML85210.1 XisH family protein [Thiothrix subterranea]
MPAYDLFHHAVKNALQKDGWVITHDPFSIPFGGIDLYIDLGAERVLAAERENQRIAVEIKCFLSPSPVSEFHTALGQFLNYRLVLEESAPERTLYLAIPNDVYKTFFKLQFTQMALQRNQVKLIVFKPDREEIVEWTN